MEKIRSKVKIVVYKIYLLILIIYLLSILILKNKFIFINQFHKYLNLSKYIYSHIKLDKDKLKSIVDLTKIGLNKKKIVDGINSFTEILINIYFISKIINIFQIIRDIGFGSLSINKNILLYYKKLYIEN